MANTMTAMFTSRHLFLEGAYNEDNVLGKYQNPLKPNSETDGKVRTQRDYLGQACFLE